MRAFGPAARRTFFLPSRQHGRKLTHFSNSVRTLATHSVWTKRSPSFQPVCTSSSLTILSSLKIPVGAGLCGWVAQNSKPIINGNPMVEPGYAGDPRKMTDLRSALAVPLGGANGPVVLLAL